MMMHRTNTVPVTEWWLRPSTCCVIGCENPAPPCPPTGEQYCDGHQYLTGRPS